MYFIPTLDNLRKFTVPNIEKIFPTRILILSEDKQPIFHLWSHELIFFEFEKDSFSLSPIMIRILGLVGTVIPKISITFAFDKILDLH